MADVNKIIKDLGDTNWSTDNEAQMKAVELLKGLAFSDDPKANEFMKAVDKATTKIALDVLAEQTGPGGHVPDGTGPHGRGKGPGKGKGDGSGLKKKGTTEEETMCQCDDCGWEGSQSELEEGCCPECGSENVSEMEMDEKSCSKKKKKNENKLPKFKDWINEKMKSKSA